jgi:hypothetical protein
VAIAGGERITATLVSAHDTAIVVAPGLRVAEPRREISYGALEQLALHVAARGSTRVGAAAVGTGVGVGVFLSLLMVMFSQLD